MRDWFTVDPRGLEKLLARRPRSQTILELIQNGFDADDATHVRVSLEHIPHTKRYRLEVEDNSPFGFPNLAHAFTLFAEDNAKKSQPSKRGRFSIGEKLVLSLCDRATISTTKGTVEFSEKGRRQLRTKRESGSLFEGEIKMTRAEAAEVERRVNTIIAPSDKTLVFNGQEIPHRSSVRSFETTLPTEIADDEGYLRRTRRRTTLSLYTPPPGEPAMLYELGLPVVETSDKFSVDIGQKVPISMDRENVTPAYLREVRTAVLNNAHDLIAGDDAAETWVDHALEDPDVSDEAVVQVLTERYGELRVAYDPSDPEANKLAVSEGYTVISGRSFNKQQWSNIRRVGAAQPAGQVTPSPKPYSDDPDAPVRKQLEEEDWTDGIRRIVSLTVALADELLHVRLQVMIVNDPLARDFSATYGGQGKSGAVFEYNLRTLGYRFFEKQPDDEELLGLIIHEFGHEMSGDHLSSVYHKALCTLGARLARLLRRHPNFFSRFEAPVGDKAEAIR